MAIQAATLKVDIVGDNRSAISAIGRVNTEMGSMGVRAGAAGAAIGTAMAAGTVAIGGYGLKVAAANEQAAIGFETLLGSGEKAQAFMKELSGFAARTPFELPGLRDASSRFLAVGLEANRVIPIMTVLGDATSAVGTGSEGIQRATTALTQMQQKGKVTGEEMLQLVEAGIPAWDALAAKLGVDVPQAQEMVSKGQVKVNDLFSALETRAGPALQRVSGMMDKQSASLTGLWSTLKDTASQGLAQAMQPAVESIKGILPQITDTLGRVFERIGPSLGRALTGLATAAGPILDALGTVAGPVSLIVEEIAKLAGALAQHLAPVFAALAPVIGEVAHVLGTVLGAALAEVGPMLAEVGKVLGEALMEVFRELRPQLPALAEALGQMAVAGAQMATAFLPLVPLFVDLLSAVLPIIVPLIQLAAFFQGLWVGAVRMAIQVIAEVIGWLFNLSGTVGAVLGFVGGFFVAVWGGITNAVGSAWAFIREVVSVGLNFIQAYVSTVLGVVSGIWNTVWSAVSAVASTIWNTIKSVVGGAIGFVRDTIGGALDWIRDRWNSIWGGIRDVLGGIWEGIKNAVRSGINGVIDILNKLIGGANFILRVVSVGKLQIPEIPKFHSGGMIDGPPGKERLIMAKTGEFVVSPEGVRAAGPGALERINKMGLHPGIGDSIWDNPVTRVLTAGTGSLLGLAREGAAAGFGAIASIANAGLDRVPGQSTIPIGIAVGAARRILAEVGTFLRGQEEKAGGPLSAAPARGLTAAATAMMNAVLQRFPGTRVTSTLRTPAQNAAVGGAKNSDHLYGRAVDFVSSMGAMDSIAAFLRSWPTIKQVLWRVAGHFDHVHGATKFDQGGWLQPGYTMAYNGTGRPERVGGAGPSVTVVVQGSLIGPSAEAVADELMPYVQSALLRHSRNNAGLGLA